MTISGVPPGRKNSAPLQALWSYRNKEEKEGKPLQEQDFDPGFFLWARSYLTPSTTNALLSEKMSILHPITLSMSQKQSASSLDRE